MKKVSGRSKVLRKKVFSSFFLCFLLFSAHRVCFSSQLGVIAERELPVVRIEEEGRAFVTERRYMSFRGGANRILLDFTGVKVVPGSLRVNFPDGEGVRVVDIFTSENHPLSFNLEIYTEKGGTKPAEISYLLDGLRTTYTYIAFLNHGYLQIEGFLTLSNHTGEEFKEAVVIDGKNGKKWYIALEKNDEKKLSLFRRKPFPSQVLYISDSRKHGPGVFWQCRVVNDTSLWLMPGRIKIYREEKEGFTFLGEDVVGFACPGDILEITVGKVQDIKVEKKLVEFFKINLRRDDVGNIQVYDTSEKYEILLKNQKTEEAKVMVREYVPDTWQLIDSSFPWKREDANTLIFEIELLPGEEKKIFYHLQRKNILFHQEVAPLTR